MGSGSELAGFSSTSRGLVSSASGSSSPLLSSPLLSSPLLSSPLLSSPLLSSPWLSSLGIMGTGATGAEGAAAASLFIFGSMAGFASGFAFDGSSAGVAGSTGVAGSIPVQGTDLSGATAGASGTQAQQGLEDVWEIPTSPQVLQASMLTAAVSTSQTGTDLQFGRCIHRSIQRPAKAELNGVKMLRLTTIASRTHDLNGLDMVQQRSHLQSNAPRTRRQPDASVTGCKATQLSSTTVAKATDWIN